MNTYADRYENWVRLSFRFVGDPERDLDIPHHVQLLGVVDAEISGVRRSDLFAQDGTPVVYREPVLLFERVLILAHLWVLGAYEFVRTISQRVKAEPELVLQSSADAIASTKRVFERIRMPLAKRERAKRHGAGDYDVPLPGVGARGIGWEVAPNEVVYQEELSDAFLQMLAALKLGRQ